jgi:hypothetical protein
VAMVASVERYRARCCRSHSSLMFYCSGLSAGCAESQAIPSSSLYVYVHKGDGSRCIRPNDAHQQRHLNHLFVTDRTLHRGLLSDASRRAVMMRNVSSLSVHFCSLIRVVMSTTFAIGIYFCCNRIKILAPVVCCGV